MTFALTFYQVLRMRIISGIATNSKLGKERLYKLRSEGRLKQFPLYSMQEMSENKKLEDVRVTFFEADSDKYAKDGLRPFAIICPGGGYAHLCTKSEGYPTAARLNELGISALVLEYRTGRDCSKRAPLDDLANLLNFLNENGEDYNLDINNYSVIGFSAGGNLAGLWGSEQFGYAKYGLPKPKSLILGYPWTNVNHWLDHAYWNIWVALIGIWLTERGNLYMFGLHNSRENRDSICVQKWVTKNYPPCFIFSGDMDVLVPASRHASVLADTLEENGITYKYKRFFRMPHGIGIGYKTRAYGWLESAVGFWMEQ